MARRGWAWGATGIVALSVIATAIFFWQRPAAAVTFSPAAGDTQTYQIGMSIGMPGASIFDRAFVLQSVVRYHVEDIDDGRIRMQVQPRFMRGRFGTRTLFDSTRADPDEPTAALLRDGFVMTIDKDGDTNLTFRNTAAQQRFETELGRRASALAQLKQQVSVPGLLDGLPARKGATQVIGGIQSLPELQYTVAKVTPTALVVDLAPAPGKRQQSLSLDSMLGGLAGHSGDVSMTLTQLRGRMQIDRETGWIDTLGLVAEQQVTADGDTRPVRINLSMRATDDPAAGGTADNMAFFARIAKQVGEDPDDAATDIPLPHASDDDAPEKQAEADKPAADGGPIFDPAGGTYEIDNKSHRIVLRLPFAKTLNGHVDSARLQGVRFFDSKGQPLALDAALAEMRYALVDDRLGQHIELVPLGWDKPDLAAIHKVQATLVGRPIKTRQQVALPLKSTPSRLQMGDSYASATPVAGQPQTWRIRLVNGNAQYTIDRDSDYQGLSAHALPRNADNPYSDFELALLDRATNPRAWRWSLEVTGKRDAFPLIVTQYGELSEPTTVSFSNIAARYTDHSAPPPDTKHLYGLGKIPDGPIRLDELTTREAERNRLRMRLPRGIGAACSLTATNADPGGYPLAWHPRQPRRTSAARDTTDAEATAQDWELTTPDGVRRYFYDTALDTRLHCPGTPEWRHKTFDGRDTPWLVDLDHTLGRHVATDTPAATFFQQARFVDDDGDPLRPMRLDARPDKLFDPWSDEAKDATLADYVADDGTVRFWGRVAAIRYIDFSGPPIDKQWHDELEGIDG